MKKILAIILTGLLAGYAYCGEVVEEGLHCEMIVQITATPADGYEFVQWSDLNIENPRSITIQDNVTLSAMFQKKEEPEPVDTCFVTDSIPLVYLYDQLVLIHRDSLKRLGYDTVSESSVGWYRIVDKQDGISIEPKTDVKAATGFYVNKSTLASGAYYVQILVREQKNECPIILRSETFYIQRTGWNDVEIDAQATKYIYNGSLYIRRGATIYDAQGRKVGVR